MTENRARRRSPGQRLRHAWIPLLIGTALVVGLVGWLRAADAPRRLQRGIEGLRGQAAAAAAAAPGDTDLALIAAYLNGTDLDPDAFPPTTAYSIERHVSWLLAKGDELLADPTDAGERAAMCDRVEQLIDRLEMAAPASSVPCLYRLRLLQWRARELTMAQLAAVATELCLEAARRNSFRTPYKDFRERMLRWVDDHTGDELVVALLEPPMMRTASVALVEHARILSAAADVPEPDVELLAPYAAALAQAAEAQLRSATGLMDLLISLHAREVTEDVRLLLSLLATPMGEPFAVGDDLHRIAHLSRAVGELPAHRTPLLWGLAHDTLDPLSFAPVVDAERVRELNEHAVAMAAERRWEVTLVEPLLEQVELDWVPPPPRAQPLVDWARGQLALGDALEPAVLQELLGWVSLGDIGKPMWKRLGVDRDRAGLPGVNALTGTLARRLPRTRKVYEQVERPSSNLLSYQAFFLTREPAETAAIHYETAIFELADPLDLELAEPAYLEIHAEAAQHAPAEYARALVDPREADPLEIQTWEITLCETLRLHFDQALPLDIEAWRAFLRSR